jgi:hypothetical protein
VSTASVQGRRLSEYGFDARRVEHGVGGARRWARDLGGRDGDDALGPERDTLAQASVANADAKPCQLVSPEFAK